MRKQHSTQIPPTTENHAVEQSSGALDISPGPRRLPNAALRSREHLTPDEVDQLLAATRHNRNRNRDWLMVDMTFRHGLRVSELAGLRWDQINLKSATVFVKRLKGGKEGTHPLQGDTLRALRQLRREQPHASFVFNSERKAPFSVSGLESFIARLGDKAGLPFKIHPHMLRHACGYALANKGTDTRSIQGYLGHSNIQNTVKYTELAPNRFKNIWD